MMTRPLRAFSLRTSSTVPRLELDTGRPARKVRYLEYHNDEQVFLLLSVRLPLLAPSSVDTAPRFERMPDWWSSHPIKGTTAIGRLINIARDRRDDELNRENTMFFNARLKTEPNTKQEPSCISPPTLYICILFDQRFCSPCMNNRKTRWPLREVLVVDPAGLVPAEADVAHDAVRPT